MVMPDLMKAFPSHDEMALALPEDIFPFIKSISYPNNKAKNLAGMARMLRDQFHGIVPDTVEELIKLPGVGRKTANVVASVIYQKPTMAVDTHVFRVARRIGLAVNANTPLAVEKQLVKYLPESTIHMAHHWLILHGRYVCLARKPLCDQCGIREICLYWKKNKHLMTKINPE